MTLFRPSSKFSHSTQTQPTASMINFFKKRIRKFFVPCWMSFFWKLALIWRIVDTFKIKLFIFLLISNKFWIFGHGTPKYNWNVYHCIGWTGFACFYLIGEAGKWKSKSRYNFDSSRTQRDNNSKEKRNFLTFHQNNKNSQN